MRASYDPTNREVTVTLSERELSHLTFQIAMSSTRDSAFLRKNYSDPKDYPLNALFEALSPIEVDVLGRDPR